MASDTFLTSADGMTGGGWISVAFSLGFRKWRPARARAQGYATT